MASNKELTVLTISGSLRAGSTNTSILLALTQLAPPDVKLRSFDGLGALPFFNPDLDGEGVAPEVQAWREALRAADAVVICSPEYAHGVPGVLKNALDWIVGSGEFMEKPTAIINASVASHFADGSLRETLTVMMARIVPDASIRVALPSNKMTADAMVADERVSGLLRDSLEALLNVARLDETTSVNGTPLVD